jgi:hypothetical protein
VDWRMTRACQLEIALPWDLTIDRKVLPPGIGKACAQVI